MSETKKVRELAFKAYLPKENMVFDSFDLKEMLLNKNNGRWDHDVIFLQFTGLFDKKGKPMYEGDIVEFDKEEWGGDNNIHAITWDRDNASFDWGGGTAADWRYRTIIGNIYENPELITP